MIHALKLKFSLDLGIGTFFLSLFAFNWRWAKILELNTLTLTSLLYRGNLCLHNLLVSFISIPFRESRSYSTLPPSILILVLNVFLLSCIIKSFPKFFNSPFPILARVSDKNSFLTNPNDSETCCLRSNVNQTEKSFLSRLLKIAWKLIAHNPRLESELIQTNSNQMFNLNLSALELIYTEFSIRMNLCLNRFGFILIENSVCIESGFIRIENLIPIRLDSFGLKMINFPAIFNKWPKNDQKEVLFK